MTDRPWWRRWLQPFSRPPEPAPLLDAATLKGLIQGIFTTHPDELNCSECYDLLDKFADELLAGKNAAEAMPLVQDHLDRCRDCRLEFEALLGALGAMV